ncbi:MobC family plasmid mobilization relaxosome protein [Muribaculaceae bacterium Isolate-002 (NCI)]|nr:MobC family plasmid mobilization relaxosome protein [Muribaculaceae bacterium Isolate-002 (NCI)]
MNRKKNRRPMPGHDIEDMYDVINLPKTIKFSLNQLNKANERKRKAGYRDFSTFARDCILNTQVVERITPEQMRILNELIREGNNLNQIAKACNSGRCFAVANQATAVLKRHNALIDLFYEIKT